MKLIFAAVCRDGEIITGKRHGNCIALAVDKHGWKPPVLQSEQGFVDEYNTYYSRSQAMDIAIEAGQMPESARGKTLYSEDLW